MYKTYQKNMQKDKVPVKLKNQVTKYRTRIRSGKEQKLFKKEKEAESVLSNKGSY